LTLRVWQNRAWQWTRQAHLGDGEAVLEVDVLALNVTRDLGILGTDTSDLEGDVGRGEGLDLEGSTLDRVVLLEEVTSGLSEVLGISA
jgi:hypothetical protein